MRMFLKSSPTTHQYVLTEEQRRMYASEKLENFRWISKIVATYSNYTLTNADIAPDELYQELAELGQFAEAAYSAVPIQFLIDNFTIMNQPDFPLENYDALLDCVLVDSFRGSVADLPAYIAFRPSTGQLVVSISGTASIKHALYDVRALRVSHPSRRGSVHSGFWALYQGLKSQLLAGIQKGISEHSPTELVLAGHSMGGSISYLLCMDLLDDQNLLPDNLKIQMAVFGVPRSGDSHLVNNFRSLVEAFQGRSGKLFKEYSVKGYNDGLYLLISLSSAQLIHLFKSNECIRREGVPALPPAFMGYRHFCPTPIYTVGGKLYQTPASECEHALFHVASDEENKEKIFLFPKGGHNYYNGRDLERFSRRINWLDKARPMESGWDERYRTIATQS